MRLAPIARRYQINPPAETRSALPHVLEPLMPPLRHTIRALALAAIVCVVTPAPGLSQGAKPDTKKKADLPLTGGRKIEFTTTKGTWMSVDVSPDGNTIVFD